MNSKIFVTKLLNLTAFYDLDDEIEICQSRKRKSFNSRFADFFTGLQLSPTSSPKLIHSNSLGGEGTSFSVNLHRIINKEDKRTTIMLRNIPNKFTVSQILRLIEPKFKNCFDLLVLPIDAKANKNFGYAFINFKHSFHILNFYHEFNNFRWPGTNSTKICEVFYSKIQGKTKLKKHYPQKNIYVNKIVEDSNYPFQFCIPNEYKEYFLMKYPGSLIADGESCFYVYSNNMKE